MIVIASLGLYIAYGASLPWELSLKEPYLSPNTFGSEILHGHRTTLKSQVANNVDYDIEFLYIMQMKDSNNTAIGITTAQRKVAGNGLTDIELYWTPKLHDSYQIDIFLWSSLDHPAPLASRSTLGLTVK